MLAPYMENGWRVEMQIDLSWFTGDIDEEFSLVITCDGYPVVSPP